MNIKNILRSIRFLALLIGNMMMAGCSNSDKPAYLEPHLITTEATHTPEQRLPSTDQPP